MLEPMCRGCLGQTPEVLLVCAVTQGWQPGLSVIKSCFPLGNAFHVSQGFFFSPTEILATLRGHSGLVKGLTWDPVGKYIASQADDRSLKVWRTLDWQLETSITKPFDEVTGWAEEQGPAARQPLPGLRGCSV